MSVGGDVEHGIPIDPKVGRITFAAAAKDVLNDHKANRKRTSIDTKRRIAKHLAPFFGNKRCHRSRRAIFRAFVASGSPTRTWFAGRVG